MLTENDRLAEEYDKAWRHDQNDKNNVQVLTTEVVRLNGEVEALKGHLEDAYDQVVELEKQNKALMRQYEPMRKDAYQLPLAAYSVHSAPGA